MALIVPTLIGNQKLGKIGYNSTFKKLQMNQALVYGSVWGLTLNGESTGPDGPGGDVTPHTIDSEAFLPDPTWLGNVKGVDVISSEVAYASTSLFTFDSVNYIGALNFGGTVQTGPGGYGFTAPAATSILLIGPWKGLIATYTGINNDGTINSTAYDSYTLLDLPFGETESILTATGTYFQGADADIITDYLPYQKTTIYWDAISDPADIPYSSGPGPGNPSGLLYFV